MPMSGARARALAVAGAGAGPGKAKVHSHIHLLSQPRPEPQLRQQQLHSQPQPQHQQHKRSGVISGPSLSREPQLLIRPGRSTSSSSSPAPAPAPAPPPAHVTPNDGGQPTLDHDQARAPHKLPQHAQRCTHSAHHSHLTTHVQHTSAPAPLCATRTHRSTRSHARASLATVSGTVAAINTNPSVECDVSPLCSSSPGAPAWSGDNGAQGEGGVAAPSREAHGRGRTRALPVARAQSVAANRTRLIRAKLQAYRAERGYMHPHQQLPKPQAHSHSAQPPHITAISRGTVASTAPQPQPDMLTLTGSAVVPSPNPWASGRRRPYEPKPKPKLRPRLDPEPTTSDPPNTGVVGGAVSVFAVVGPPSFQPQPPFPSQSQSEYESRPGTALAWVDPTNSVELDKLMTLAMTKAVAQPLDLDLDLHIAFKTQQLQPHQQPLHQLQHQHQQQLAAPPRVTIPDLAADVDVDVDVDADADTGEVGSDEEAFPVHVVDTEPHSPLVTGRRHASLKQKIARGEGQGHGHGYESTSGTGGTSAGLRSGCSGSCKSGNAAQPLNPHSRPNVQSQSQSPSCPPSAVAVLAARNHELATRAARAGVSNWLQPEQEQEPSHPPNHHPHPRDPDHEGHALDHQHAVQHSHQPDPNHGGGLLWTPSFRRPHDADGARAATSAAAGNSDAGAVAVAVAVAGFGAGVKSTVHPSLIQRRNRLRQQIDALIGQHDRMQASVAGAAAAVAVTMAPCPEPSQPQPQPQPQPYLTTQPRSPNLPVSASVGTGVEAGAGAAASPVLSGVLSSTPAAAAAAPAPAPFGVDPDLSFPALERAMRMARARQQHQQHLQQQQHQQQQQQPQPSQPPQPELLPGPSQGMSFGDAAASFPVGPPVSIVGGVSVVGVGVSSSSSRLLSASTEVALAQWKRKQQLTELDKRASQRTRTTLLRHAFDRWRGLYKRSVSLRAARAAEQRAIMQYQLAEKHQQSKMVLCTFIYWRSFVRAMKQHRQHAVTIIQRVFRGCLVRREYGRAGFRIRQQQQAQLIHRRHTLQTAIYSWLWLTRRRIGWQHSYQHLWRTVAPPLTVPRFDRRGWFSREGKHRMAQEFHAWRVRQRVLIAWIRLLAQGPAQHTDDDQHTTIHINTNTNTNINTNPERHIHGPGAVTDNQHITPCSAVFTCSPHPPCPLTRRDTRDTAHPC